MEHAVFVARILLVLLAFGALVQAFRFKDAPVEHAAAAPAPAPVRRDRTYRPCGYFQEFGGRSGWSCSMADRF